MTRNILRAEPKMVFPGLAWAACLPKSASPTRAFTTDFVTSRGSRAQFNTPRRKRSTTVMNSEDASDDDTEKEEPHEPSAGERYLQTLQQLTEAETALSNPLGLKMSHEIIRFDEDGIGPRDRYVYVEERDCIGCTHCATTANQTFFMHDDFGRARVFSQTGDIEEVISEAIATCPVNCIYYVDWSDLVILEKDRKDQVINNYTRLVGGHDASGSRTARRKTKVMDSGVIRCEDCPGRGCQACPLYGVGENPAYLEKKSMRESLKKSRADEDRKKRRRLL